MRVDKAYSEVKKKPKSINVRPGLALGVITLQVKRQREINLFVIFLFSRLELRDCNHSCIYKALDGILGSDSMYKYLNVKVT